MAKDQQTRYPGVYARHQKHCHAPDGRRCNCTPGFMARAYDRATTTHDAALAGKRD